MQTLSDSFNRLVSVIKTLRSPNGCPWDKEQTPKSMRNNLMEETFEAIDAITTEDFMHAKEELGDCLFNILFIAYMFEQNGDFSICDVFNDVCDKLIRRHPHVFENKPLVPSMWDKIKENVEGRRFSATLDEVPKGFPPLLKSYKMLSKAAKLNFDWKTVEDAKKKVYEELSEVEDSYAQLKSCKEKSKEQNQEKLHLEEELGDLLLSVVNLSRKCKVDPNVALDRANRKFYSRFSFVEQKMKDSAIPFTKENLTKMEDFWIQAKSLQE